MLRQLRCANTIDAVEQALSLHDVSSSITADAKKEINILLDGITFETTSKFRRRVKRFQETLTSDAVAALAASAGTTKFLHSASQKSTFITQADANSIIQLTVDESIIRLHSCQTLRDIEHTMNTLSVATDADGDDKKQKMKSALRGVLNLHSTNKLLRRRINRLIFVLSNSDEKEQEKKTAKIRAEANNKRAGSRQLALRDIVVSTHQTHQSPSNVCPMKTPLLSVTETDSILNKCLQQLIQASSAAEVEAAIAALPPLTIIASPHTIDQKLKASLHDKLNVLGENNALVSNAKLRRRVKRLKDFFDEASQTDAAEVVHSVAVVEGTVDVQHANVTTDASDSRPPCPIAALGNFATSLKALEAAITADELESSMNDLTMDSIGTEEEKVAFAVRLRFELSRDNMNGSLIGNAKARRKAKRLLEMLDARYPAAHRVQTTEESVPSSGEAAAKQKKKKDKEKKPDLKNPPAGPSLDSVIEQVTEIRTGKMTVEQLGHSVLAEVNEHSGNCGSRRLLKRALERIITDDALTSEMTSRTKRKLVEVIETLSPKLTT